MLSTRIQSLREVIGSLDQVRRHVPQQTIAAYTPDQAKSPILRHAEAYARVLAEVTVNELPGERLAGNNLDKFCPRPAYLTEAELAEIRAYPAGVPQELLNALTEEVFYLWAWSDGHILPGYEKVLRLGITGVREELFARRRDPALTASQREFLEAALLQWDAVLAYIGRHSRHYLEAASRATEEAERARCLELARLCARVPRHPATTFHEALQSVWFTFIATQFDDCSNHSLGRLDQYLYPYYVRDLEAGLLDAGLARDLLQEFWLKFNLGYRLQELEKVRIEGKGVAGSWDVTDGASWLTLRVIDETHPDIGQTLDICGLDADGEDASNELSRFIVEAVDELRTFEPKPVVKVTPKTDRDLLRRCFAINASGFGLPSFSFHAAGAEGLRRYDGLFAEEDIRNHSHIGCVELGIPGKSYTDPMNAFVNLPKIVLITLRGGYYGDRLLGLPLPRPETWEAFLEDFYRQLEYFVRLYTDGLNACYPFYARFFHRPLVSSLIEGCVEKAVPVDLGGSTYWVKGVNCTGFATAVDSLYAIKALVFDSGRLSLSELSKVLDDDFSGQEVLRQEIRNKLPKFGNGQSEVDRLAHDLAVHYTAAVRACRTWGGGRYRPGLYSFYGPIKTMGKATGATPDGRKAGQVLSLNGAPSHGSLKNGVAAALESVAAVDHSLFDNAATVDVQLAPGVPPEVIGHIVDYLSSKGVLYVQFSVVSREDLLGAQASPDLYQDLVVRVTGFSARFLSLPTETQAEIIERSWWG